MENRIHQLMQLEDGTKYAIVNQAIYKNVNYFVAVRLTDDEEDITDEFKIFEESFYEGKPTVDEVKDEEILKILIENLKLLEE